MLILGFSFFVAADEPEDGGLGSENSEGQKVSDEGDGKESGSDDEDEFKELKLRASEKCMDSCGEKPDKHDVLAQIEHQQCLVSCHPVLGDSGEVSGLLSTILDINSLFGAGSFFDVFFDIFTRLNDLEEEVDSLQSQVDDLTSRIEALESGTFVPVEICGDGIDNDSDGLIDEPEPAVTEGFPGVDWAFCDLSWSDLTGFDLSGANLEGADLSFSSFIGVNFSGTNFAGANMYGAYVDISDFSFSDFSGVDGNDAEFLGSNFRYANLSYTNFSNSDLENSDMSFSDMTGTDFSEVDVGIFNHTGCFGHPICVI